jgi:hypothetical protein
LTWKSALIAFIVAPVIPLAEWRGDIPFVLVAVYMQGSALAAAAHVRHSVLAAAIATVRVWGNRVVY